MKFKEVEFKYRAENISLSAFTKFAINRKPISFVYAAGYDHFYAHPKHPDAFCRHRIGPDMNQLTFKRKTTDKDNYIRTEYNIDLDTKVPTDQITALCKEFGYEYNTSLMKNCFIYKFDFYILVYYVCFDADMKEIGRFFEIEAREDYKWATEHAAWDAIAAVEKFCKPLGISAQSRVKKSLWEMFKK